LYTRCIEKLITSINFVLDDDAVDDDDELDWGGWMNRLHVSNQNVLTTTTKS